jgi:peptide/nickel transport system substrate-binding protein
MKFTKIGFILFVILAVFLTACGSESVGPDTGNKPTATVPALATATRGASSSSSVASSAASSSLSRASSSSAASGATATPARRVTPATGPVVPPPVSTAKGNSVVMGTTDELTHINPLLSTSWIVNALAGLSLEGLVEIDATGNFVPVLADGFPTQSSDKLSLTYKIKKGVKFANGDELTCADVKFTQEAAVAKGSRVKALYEDIASVDCPDDYTAVVKFSQAYTDFLQLFSYVLPRTAGDPANLENWDYNKAPFGTGPFAVAVWKPKDSITYSPNKNYREKGKPALDSVTVKFMSSTKTALKDLAAGDINILLDLNEEDLPGVKALTSQGVNFVTVPDGSAMTLFFNLSDPKVDAADAAKNPHPILGDLKVRQAIQLGIDKNQLIQSVVGASIKPGTSILNVGPFGCKINPSAFNVNDAKSLLDSAGWRVGSDGIRSKGGVRMSLSITTYSSDSLKYGEPVAKALVPMMKAIGIELNVNIVTYREFEASWDNKGLRKHGAFDMILYATGPDVDPDNFLQTTLSSSGIPTVADKGAGANYSRYSSKDMDALIDKAASSPDGKAKQQLYCQAAGLVSTDLPRVLLYETQEVTAYHSQLQNFVVSPGPMDFTFGAANWSIKK